MKIIWGITGKALIIDYRFIKQRQEEKLKRELELEKERKEQQAKGIHSNGHCYDYNYDLYCPNVIPYRKTVSWKVMRHRSIPQ